MTKTRTNNKKLNKEKKRPEYKPKPKQMKPEYPEPQILYEDGIPYIVLGNTPYAVDDKGIIDYSLTRWLRDKLDKKV